MDLGTLMTTFGADLDPLYRSVGQAQGEFEKYQKSGKDAFENVSKSAAESTKSITESFKTLNIKSDASYNELKQSAENAFSEIKKSAESSSNDVIRAELAKNEIVKKLQAEQAESIQTTYDKAIEKVEEYGAIAIKVASVVGTTVLAFMKGAELGGVAGGVTSASVALALELAGAFAVADASAADLEDKYQKIYDARKNMELLGISEKSINQDINVLIGDQLSTWSKIKEQLPEILQELIKQDEQDWKTINSLIGAVGKIVLPETSTAFNTGDINDQMTQIVSSIQKTEDELTKFYESATETEQKELAKQFVMYRDNVNEITKTQAEKHELMTIAAVQYYIKSKEILAKGASEQLTVFQKLATDIASTVTSTFDPAMLDSVIELMKQKFAVMQDAEEISNTIILKNADAAHQLRLAKEQTFRESLLKIVEDYQQRMFEADRKASGQDIMETEYDKAKEITKKYQADITASTQLGHTQRVAAIKQEQQDMINAAKVTGESLTNITALTNEKLAAEAKRMEPPIDTAADKLAADAARIAAAWVEMQAKLQLRIDAQGMTDLQVKLATIEAATESAKRSIADWPESIKAVAFAMMDQANAIDKTKAVIDSEVVSMKAKEAQELIEVEAVNLAIKAYDRLEKQYGLTLDISDQLDAGTKIIIARFIAIGQTAEDAAPKIQLLKDILEGRNAETQDAFYKDLEGYEQEYYSKKLESIEAQRKANVKLYGEEAAQINALQSIRNLDQEVFAKKLDSINSVVSGFDKLTDVTMSYYNKDSDEYKRAAEAKKVILIAQQGLEVAKNAQIIASNIGLIASNTSVALSSAGTAVVGAAIGVGPTGFATAAAMIVLLASVFAMYGIAGGGSASVSVPTQSGTAASQGSSGVLGAASDVGSQSIKNSMDLLKDTYNMEDQRLKDIYNEMAALNSNITAVVTSIARTGGLSSVKLPEDTINPFVENFGKAWDNFMWHLDFIGKFVTSLVGTIFGGDSKTTIKWTGIEFGNMLVSDLMKGVNFAAKQFTTIHTETSGGWFGGGSDSVSTIYDELAPQVLATLKQVFHNMSSSLLAIASGLGVDVGKVMDYAFELTQVDLKGMTSEQINKTLNEYFSGVMDKAVNTLFGDMIRQYQQLNEGLMETAVRLIQDKSVIQSIISMSNQSFAGDIPAVIAFSEHLISLAGDLKTLSDAASTYFDKFFSDSEKQTIIQGQLSAAMASMNMVLPDTREGYRKLIEGLDLSTEAGQKAYVALLEMSSSADQFYSAVEAHKTAVASFVTDFKSHYDSVMGITQSAIEANTEWFDKAYAQAIALGASEEQLAEIRRIEGETNKKLAADKAAADAKAINDYWQGMADYYTGLMDSGSSMQKQFDDIAKKFDEAREKAKGLSNETEALTVLQQAQANVIKKIIDDWGKALVQPLMDLKTAMGEWYQSTVQGLSQIDVAMSSLMQYRQRQGWSATGQSDVLNFNGLSLPGDSDKISAYVAEIVKFAQSVTQALEATYTALQNTRNAISTQIQEISLGGMTAQQQADYYAGKIPSEQQFKDMMQTMATEDVPAAIEDIRSNMTKYYDLEKQIIKDKYQLISEAESKKAAAELSNIQAVRDKLRSMQFGSANIALPSDKVQPTSDEYHKLFTEAQTGDTGAVSRFLSFTDTAIQVAKDADKSSQMYQDVYAQIIKDITSLDTKPTVTIEDLTKTQNNLIKEQTTTLSMALAELDKSMIKGLEILGGGTTKPLADTIDRLVVAYGIIDQLVKAGYSLSPTGIENQTAATMMTGSMTGDEVAAFNKNKSSVMADGIVTQAEISLAGFVAMHDDNVNLYDGLLAWATAEIALLTAISANTAAAKAVSGSGFISTQLSFDMADPVTAGVINWLKGAPVAPGVLPITLKPNMFDNDTNRMIRWVDGTNMPVEFITTLRMNIADEATKGLIAWAEGTKRPVGAITASFVLNSDPTTQGLLAWASGANVPAVLNTTLKLNMADPTTASLLAWASGANVPVAMSTKLSINTADTQTALLLSWMSGTAATLPLHVVATMDAPTSPFESWFESTFTNSLVNWAVTEMDWLSKITYNTAQIAGALSMAHKYSEGGIASGPASGYMATLHGTELVVSPRNPVSVRMSGKADGYNDPELKALVKELIAVTKQKQNINMTVEDGKSFPAYIKAYADEVRVSANERKGVNRRRLF